MARRRRPTQEGSATKTLDELESAGDRLTLWLGEHQRELLAGAVGLLLLAGGWGYMATTGQEQADQADTALSEVQTGYRVAMGADPGSVVVPEPANAEAARDIRNQFSARFAEIGEAYPGTAAGAVAFLETGKLQQALGDADAAIAAYQAGIDSLGENDALRGFLWSRMGSVYEAEGRWSEAAGAYAKAGGLKSYAIHAGAMASAIRAYIHAGEPTAALGAADELARTEPDFVLPQFLQAQIDELRLATALN